MARKVTLNLIDLCVVCVWVGVTARFCTRFPLELTYTNLCFNIKKKIVDCTSQFIFEFK